MSQEQQRDILDMANEVVAQQKNKQVEEDTRYFRQLAYDEMKKQRPDERWLPTASVCIHVTDVDGRRTQVTIWVVTCVQIEQERVGVVNVVFQDCDHSNCPGHILEVVEGYTVGNE